MVVGPDWKGQTPPEIKKVFRSSTWLSVSGYRTQLYGPDDLDAVKQVQAGYKVRPLSAYLQQPAPPAAPAIDFPKNTGRRQRHLRSYQRGRGHGSLPA
jgi:hypothetical protein